MLADVHTSFSHRRVIINMDQIVKIIPFTDDTGSTIFFTDGSKIPVDEKFSYFMEIDMQRSRKD